MIIVKDILREKATWFILAVSAMTSLVACTKMEDMAPPRKITFETATYRPQTKAEVSIMSEFTSFKCKAFLHAEGYSDTQDMFTAAGETISAYTSGNVITTTTGEVAYWAPSHDYYWPKGTSSYINFIGWYDKDNAVPATATETQLVWNYVVDDVNDNLLYAEEAWHYKATPDPAEYHKDGSVSKGVPMLFHHALAKLCIKAKVSDTTKENVTGGAALGNTTWDVTLSNISLAGVYSQGTLTLTNTEPSGTTAATNDWTATWASTGTAAPISMNAISTPLTQSEVDVLAMRTVLPQEVTSSMILSFDYNIITKFNGTEYAHEKIHASIPLSSFEGLSGQAIGSWDMNKKITYTIIINPVTTKIQIDPAMVDWILETGGTTTL